MSIQDGKLQNSSPSSNNKPIETLDQLIAFGQIDMQLASLTPEERRVSAAARRQRLISQNAPFLFFKLFFKKPKKK